MATEPIVAITSGFGSNGAAEYATERLEREGITIAKICTNSCGFPIESRFRSLGIDGVLDLSISDLLGREIGNDRLTTAGTLGIPQVISVGGLDYHEVERRETVAEEVDDIGKSLVEAACAARSPTIILIPLKGISSRPQNEAVNHALFQSIRNWVYPPDLLFELNLHINEPAFGIAAAEELLKLMRRVS